MLVTNYRDKCDEMIHNRLIVGIRDAALSRNLQFDAELTLDKAKKIIRQQVAVGEQRELNITAAERADITHGLVGINETPHDETHP